MDAPPDLKAIPELVTFGCRLNSVESETIRAQAEAAGVSDAIIVNTCAVTAEAVRQGKQAIRKLRRENPGKRIVVTGCAAQIDPQGFAEMEAVDLVLGNKEKTDPAQWRRIAGDNTPPGGLGGPDFGVTASEKVRVDDIMSVRETANHLIDGFRDRARAFVQVQNGCDHRCTFCIIPYGRGDSRSAPMGHVVAQIERLTGAGYREIVLTGVDLTSYGADLPGKPRLGDLVQKILGRPGAPERLRLSSIDSIEADPALMEAITGDRRVMPHLHLSLQAGADMILKRMKRRHLRADAIRFCEEVRAKRPDMVFGADLIAGFPTETEEMFQDSLRLVEECGLTFLHVFPFSPRAGTPAARMPQVAKAVGKERAARLRALGEAREAAYLASQIGVEQAALMETESLGRSEGYALIRFTEPRRAGEVVRVAPHAMADGALLAA